jgi:hypothetical protein
MGGAPGQVYVVRADSGAGDHLHPRAGKGFCITTGAGADYDGIGIRHGCPVYGPAVQINYFCEGFQDPFQERNIGICNDFHTLFCLEHTKIINVCELNNYHYLCAQYE